MDEAAPDALVSAVKEVTVALHEANLLVALETELDNEALVTVLLVHQS